MSKLHTILAPFMMRRLKSEVEKNMPLKELVVYVPMSEPQREMYELIVKIGKGRLMSKESQRLGTRAVKATNWMT